MEKGYKNSVVAFIDILGFRKMVDNSVDNAERFDNIFRALEVMKYRKKRNRGTEHKEGMMVSIFSDSIVVSNRGGPIIADLEELLEDVMFIQNDLLRYNIVCRGGISVGPLYHSKSKVFGPALNKAYDLERKRACYPRVVLEEDIFRQCEKIDKLTYDDKKIKQVSCKYLRTGKDEKNKNLLYVDYLHKYVNICNENVEEYIKKCKRENKDNYDVYQKYEWMLNYIKGEE